MQRKPTLEEIRAASGKTVPDIIAPNLHILFCGINPSLYSAAVGHHFARPGNRFWRSLYGAGFTERLFAPFEDRDLLQFGYGLTNIVERATARADELGAEELVTGQQQLAAKVAALSTTISSCSGEQRLSNGVQSTQSSYGATKRVHG